MKQITYRRKYGLHRFGVRRVGASRLVRMLIGFALLQGFSVAAFPTTVAGPVQTVAPGVVSSGVTLIATGSGSTEVNGIQIVSSGGTSVDTL